VHVCSRIAIQQRGGARIAGLVRMSPVSRRGRRGHGSRRIAVLLLREPPLYLVRRVVRVRPRSLFDKLFSGWPQALSKGQAGGDLAVVRHRPLWSRLRGSLPGSLRRRVRMLELLDGPPLPPPRLDSH
jgi:hypothetical protein